MTCGGGSRISRRGGVDLVGGGVDSRGSYVSKILYVKTKELGPLRGARAGRAPPRSANDVKNGNSAMITHGLADQFVHGLECSIEYYIYVLQWRIQDFP